MTFQDHFSKDADRYAAHRPRYPEALFEYLASVAPGHERAWDCGTGNGQAAHGLAPYFREVIATDPSEEQVRNALPHEKITYRVAPAEDPGLESASVDLITVAQALHWFDIPRFYEEVRRTLKPGGVLAAWMYSLHRTAPEVDRIIDDFFWRTVRPYAPEQFKYVDDGYASLPFPFEELEPPPFTIELEWNLHEVLAYVRTWSPVRSFIEREGYDPLAKIEAPLREAWGDADEARRVVWPLHMRVGRL
jgi:SAM-dependent methyltransferase